MPVVHSGPLVGLAAQLTLLTALAATIGLSGIGWVVGVGCGLVADALIEGGMRGYGTTRPGPADWVTLVRVTLAVGVAAVTADSFVTPTSVTSVVALAVVALVLDAVDGRVARRSRTASAFGARFDGEADAFLILVLSVYVARSAGAWVVAIGVARYAFLAAGWWLPWMRGTLPVRYWRKVVAACQGIALTIAASSVLPPSLTTAVLVGAAVLLTESFGRDVVWLWHRRALGAATFGVDRDRSRQAMSPGSPTTAAATVARAG